MSRNTTKKKKNSGTKGLKKISRCHHASLKIPYSITNEHQSSILVSLGNLIRIVPLLSLLYHIPKNSLLKAFNKYFGYSDTYRESIWNTGTCILVLISKSVYRCTINPLTPRRTLVAPFTKISILF